MLPARATVAGAFCECCELVSWLDEGRPAFFKMPVRLAVAGTGMALLSLANVCRRCMVMVWLKNNSSSNSSSIDSTAWHVIRWPSTLAA